MLHLNHNKLNVNSSIIASAKVLADQLSCYLDRKTYHKELINFYGIIIHKKNYINYISNLREFIRLYIIRSPLKFSTQKSNHYNSVTYKRAMDCIRDLLPSICNDNCLSPLYIYKDKNIKQNKTDLEIVNELISKDNFSFCKLPSLNNPLDKNINPIYFLASRNEINTKKYKMKNVKIDLNDKNIFLWISHNLEKINFNLSTILDLSISDKKYSEVEQSDNKDTGLNIFMQVYLANIKEMERQVLETQNKVSELIINGKRQNSEDIKEYSVSNASDNLKELENTIDSSDSNNNKAILSLGNEDKSFEQLNTLDTEIKSDINNDYLFLLEYEIIDEVNIEENISDSEIFNLKTKNKIKNYENVDNKKNNVLVEDQLLSDTKSSNLKIYSPKLDSNLKGNICNKLKNKKYPSINIRNNQSAQIQSNKKEESISLIVEKVVQNESKRKIQINEEKNLKSYEKPFWSTNKKENEDIDVSY